jgi:hypothetical protein
MCSFCKFPTINLLEIPVPIYSLMRNVAFGVFPMGSQILIPLMLSRLEALMEFLLE